MKEGLSFWKSNPIRNVTSIKEKFGVISGYSTDCLIVAAGGRDAFDFVKEKVEKGNVSFQALGCASEPEVIALLLGKIIELNDANFQPPNVRRNVWETYEGVGTLKFVHENFATSKALDGEDALVNNVEATVPRFSTKEQLKEMQGFMQPHTTIQYEVFTFSLLNDIIEDTIVKLEADWGCNVILLRLSQVWGSP